MFWLTQKRNQANNRTIENAVKAAKSSGSKIGVFLDDERYPADVIWADITRECKLENWYVVRNNTSFLKFIHYLYQYKIDVNNIYLSFDHDLELIDLYNHEINGKTIIENYVKFLQDNGKQLPPKENIFYHTMNPVGQKNMRSYIENYREYSKKVFAEKVELHALEMDYYFL